MAQFTSASSELLFKFRTGETIDLRNGKYELAWDLATRFPEPRILRVYDDEDFMCSPWWVRGPFTVLETKRYGICFAMQWRCGLWTFVKKVPHHNSKMLPSDYRRDASEEYFRHMNKAKEICGENYWDGLEDVWW